MSIRLSLRPQSRGQPPAAEANLLFRNINPEYLRLDQAAHCHHLFGMPDGLAGQLADVDQPFHAVAQFDEYSKGSESRHLTLRDIARPQPQQLAAVNADCIPVMPGGLFARRTTIATFVDHDVPLAALPNAQDYLTGGPPSTRPRMTTPS